MADSVDKNSASVRNRKKRIVVCCDGTGNDFSSPNVHPHDDDSGCNSNVVKFYTSLEVGRTAQGIEQVAYYHPGVGTMGAPTATNAFTRLMTKIGGLAFGLGFKENVFDAYRYLMENYNDNGGGDERDEVYIVGFSRGAYTARALAGLLDGYGLLCRGNEGHLPYAWKMYAEQHEHRGLREPKAADSFKETFSHKDFRIHFVGVWDTVSSVGWIAEPLRLFNVAKNETIDIARHAISIDERRCFFNDNLWGEPSAKTDLLQVWFSGVHSDVGGSYPQDGSGLSTTTLKWMLAEAKLAGLEFNEERKCRVLGGNPVPAKDAAGNDTLQCVAIPTHDLPNAEDADKELLYLPPLSYKMHDSMNWKWMIIECLPHLYYDKDLAASMGHGPHADVTRDDSAELYHIPFGRKARTIPNGAMVHCSVVKRMDIAGYKPVNLDRAMLTVDSRNDLEGRPYFRYQAPLAAPPGKLKQFFQSAGFMKTVGWLEAIVALFVLLWLLHFVVWLLHLAWIGLIWVDHSLPVEWRLRVHSAGRWIAHVVHVLLPHPGALRWTQRG